ncbi:hypothetical protein DFH27DRAFT_480985 [Peziza echinospora]|nr:hypothetical protein DFH27DRAFT_480985 [Peziza echinospora]
MSTISNSTISTNPRSSSDQQSINSAITSSTRGSLLFASPDLQTFNSSTFSPQEFNLPRPHDDRIIEQLFLELMIKRGWTNLPEQARRQMQAYPADKKWTLVHQDKLTDWQTEQKKRAQGSTGQTGAQLEGSPEWFVKRVMEGSITTKQLQSLSVSLRTQPISWVRAFIEAQGQVALTTVLRSINNHGTKTTGNQEKDLEREYDIVKCLKALMNNKYGADDALQHQGCVAALTASLTSPRVTTRKLVSEVLTFLCHWDRPNGHSKVLAALDQIKNQQNETGRFDAWLRIVEVTIDGRGKLGSLVGASEEVRSGGIGMENLLMEYALATLFLINSLAQADDVNARIHIRAQFKGCGFARISGKMRQFKYELIDKQIERYEEDSQVDYEDLLERDGSSMIEGHEGADARDLNDPVSIVEVINSRVQGSRTQDYFISALQHLLLIKDDTGDDRLRLFQLIDAILGHVVMDRRMPDMDLKASLNFSIQGIMDKLKVDAEATHYMEEASLARQAAEAASAERDIMAEQVAMGADGLIAKLKEQIEEQDRALEMQRRMADGLQSELNELQRVHMQQLQKNELETRELYLMLRDAQDAATAAEVDKTGGLANMSASNDKPKLATKDVTQMQGIMDRQKLMEKLAMQLERKKAEFKLEGKQWQQIAPSDKLRELREKMDAVQREARSLEQQHLEEQVRQGAVGLGSVTRAGLSRGGVRRNSVISGSGSRKKRMSRASNTDRDSLLEEGELATDLDSDGGVKAEFFEGHKVVKIDYRRPKAKDAGGPGGAANYLKELQNRVPRLDASDDDDIDGDDELPKLKPKKKRKSTVVENEGSGDEDDGVTIGSSRPSVGSDAPKTPTDEAPNDNGKNGFMAGFNGPSAPASIGAPPPPPPMPGFNAGGGWLQNKGIPGAPQMQMNHLGGYRPKKKLKPMHWEKLDGVEYTLWASRKEGKEALYAELHSKGILDEIERMFVFKESKLGTSKKSANEKKQLISNEIQKTFQIALSKYASLPASEVARKIITCDKDMLDNPAILDFLQKDEMSNIPDNLMKQMAPYSKDWTQPDRDQLQRELDPSELTREDQIYLETCYELHHYWKSRTRALVMTRTMLPDYQELVGKLTQVMKVSDAIRESENFKGILDIILSLGNYMNDANKQATGFKLGSLQRLVNTKDEKNRRNFLDFVERTVRSKFPQFEEFLEELHECHALEKVDVDNLRKEAKIFIDNVNNIQQSVDFGNLSDKSKFHPQDRTLQVLLPILPEARKKAGYMGDHLKEMSSTYDKLLTLFGEDPTEESARKGFFKKISQFLKDYKASQLKNLDIEEDERRLAKRHEMLNAAQNKAAEKISPHSPTSTGAMDSLLQKLRDAGPTQRQQREARKLARLKANAKQRQASGSSFNPVVTSPSTLSPESAIPAATGRKSSQSKRSAKALDDDPASRAQNMLQLLKGGGDAPSGAGDESDSVLSSLGGSFRMSRRTSADEGRRARRRQRQASSATSSSNITVSGTIGSRSAEDSGAGSPRVILGMTREDTSGGAANGNNGGNSGGLPTPTIEIVTAEDG